VHRLCQAQSASWVRHVRGMQQGGECAWSGRGKRGKVAGELLVQRSVCQVASGGFDALRSHGVYFGPFAGVNLSFFGMGLRGVQLLKVKYELERRTT